MEKNCTICGEKFTTDKETSIICSHSCMLVWLKTDEFNNGLCEALGITKEKKDEEGNNI
jgi:hypothetical protein